MTKIEKQICIDNILEGLEGNHIPYKHDKRRRIIYINDVDVTKLLLAACEVYVRREEELHTIAAKDRIEAYGKLNEVKRCLGHIVYMYDSGLYKKNELAFARFIAEAQDLLKE